MSELLGHQSILDEARSALASIMRAEHLRADSFGHRLTPKEVRILTLSSRAYVARFAQEHTNGDENKAAELLYTIGPKK